MANNRLANLQGEIIGIADILFATTAANSNTPNQLNGSITLNLGFAETGEMQSQQAELWNAPGIISVPSLPTSANNNTDAAQGLYFNCSDQNIIFAVRDTRTQAIAGNINPGETCVYAPGGKGTLLCKTDGSVSRNTVDSNGNNWIDSFGPDGWYVVTPFGKLSLDAAGFRISLPSGASFALMPTSDPTTGSACILTAGSTNITSSFVGLGPAAAFPVCAGTVPVAAPGIPILGEGTGAVVVNAVGSSTVFVSP